MADGMETLEERLEKQIEECSALEEVNRDLEGELSEAQDRVKELETEIGELKSKMVYAEGGFFEIKLMAERMWNAL